MEVAKFPQKKSLWVRDRAEMCGSWDRTLSLSLSLFVSLYTLMSFSLFHTHKHTHTHLQTLNRLSDHSHFIVSLPFFYISLFLSLSLSLSFSLLPLSVSLSLSLISSFSHPSSLSPPFFSLPSYLPLSLPHSLSHTHAHTIIFHFLSFPRSPSLSFPFAHTDSAACLCTYTHANSLSFTRTHSTRGIAETQPQLQMNGNNRKTSLFRAMGSSCSRSESFVVTFQQRLNKFGDFINFFLNKKDFKME